MYKILLFNHYHRGDLFTHKAYAKHLKELIPECEFGYLHFNHPKVNLDLGIPLVGQPSLNHTEVAVRATDGVLINTWVGAYSALLKKHDGINLPFLHESWSNIFNILTEVLGRPIIINPDPNYYIPDTDYSFYDTKTIDTYLESSNKRRVLVCNGRPMSHQSNNETNLQTEIDLLASRFPSVDFIATSKYETSMDNILFTDNIIQDGDVFTLNAPWHDRPVNNCDLNEISYLSRHCDIIVGRNSGPSVFCETKTNYMDETKSFLMFTWGESLSIGVPIKCRHEVIKDHSGENIINRVEKEIRRVYEI